MPREEAQQKARSASFSKPGLNEMVYQLSIIPYVKV